MNRAELSEKMRKVQVALLILSRRYDSEKQQFDTACFAGDGVQAARHRAAIHNILDEQLDCCATAMTLTRQLMEAGS